MIKAIKRAVITPNIGGISTLKNPDNKASSGLAASTTKLPSCRNLGNTVEAVKYAIEPDIIVEP